MFVRDDMEKDYRELFKKYKMGTTIWSPLLGGVLTGKYINEIPKDSRFRQIMISLLIMLSYTMHIRKTEMRN